MHINSNNKLQIFLYALAHIINPLFYYHYVGNACVKKMSEIVGDDGGGVKKDLEMSKNAPLNVGNIN